MRRIKKAPRRFTLCTLPLVVVAAWALLPACASAQTGPPLTEEAIRTALSVRGRNTLDPLFADTDLPLF